MRSPLHICALPILAFASLPRASFSLNTTTAGGGHSIEFVVGKSHPNLRPYENALPLTEDDLKLPPYHSMGLHPPLGSSYSGMFGRAVNRSGREWDGLFEDEEWWSSCFDTVVTSVDAAEPHAEVIYDYEVSERYYRLDDHTLAQHLGPQKDSAVSWNWVRSVIEADREKMAEDPDSADIPHDHLVVILRVYPYVYPKVRVRRVHRPDDFYHKEQTEMQETKLRPEFLKMLKDGTTKGLMEFVEHCGTHFVDSTKLVYEMAVVYQYVRDSSFDEGHEHGEEQGHELEFAQVGDVDISSPNTRRPLTTELGREWLDEEDNEFLEMDDGFVLEHSTPPAERDTIRTARSRMGVRFRGRPLHDGHGHRKLTHFDHHKKLGQRATKATVRTFGLGPERDAVDYFRDDIDQPLLLKNLIETTFPIIVSDMYHAYVTKDQFEDFHGGVAYSASLTPWSEWVDVKELAGPVLQGDARFRPVNINTNGTIIKTLVPPAKLRHYYLQTNSEHLLSINDSSRVKLERVQRMKQCRDEIYNSTYDDYLNYEVVNHIEERNATTSGQDHHERKLHEGNHDEPDRLPMTSRDYRVLTVRRLREIWDPTNFGVMQNRYEDYVKKYVNSCRNALLSPGYDDMVPNLSLGLAGKKKMEYGVRWGQDRPPVPGHFLVSPWYNIPECMVENCYNNQAIWDVGLRNFEDKCILESTNPFESLDLFMDTWCDPVTVKLTSNPPSNAPTSRFRNN